MPNTEPEGRRITDEFSHKLSAETLHYLLSDLKEDMGELKLTMREGFGRLDTQMEQFELRMTALERFRERVEERDRALARAEGALSMRWPAVAALLTIGGIVVGVVVAVLQSHA